MGNENPNAGAGAAGAGAGGDNGAANGNPGGADPSKNGAGAGDASKGFDPSSLKDDDFAKLYDDPRLYKHTRFKELTERAAKAKEYEEAEEKRKQEEMVKKGEWEKLAKQKDDELTSLKAKVRDGAIKAAIQAAASKKGIQDIDAAFLLANKSNVTVNDDGTVSGAAEAIEALAKERSYLLTVNRSTVGSPTNPGNPGTNGKFKMSQLQDPTFYREHEKEIRQALANGEVEEDRFQNQ